MNRQLVVLESPDFFLEQLERVAAQEKDDLIVISPDARHRGRRGVIELDPREHLDEAVAEVKRLVGTPDAVLTSQEMFLTQAAAIADAFGVSHSTPGAMSASRDKALMKQAWQRSGVRTPRGVHATSMREAAAAARHLEYPLIVKPSMGYASCGVRLVTSEEELSAQLRAVFLVNATVLARENLTGAGVLLEEFVNGPEFSVDTVWCAGEPLCEAILAKGDLPGPYFPDRLYHLDPTLPDDTADTIRELSHAAVRSLGFAHGATHTEIRFRAGEPFVLETTNRPGAGGLFYELFNAAYGVDFHRAYYLAAVSGSAADVREQVDLAVRVRPAPDTHLFWYNLPHAESGVVQQVNGLAALAARPEVTRVLCYKGPGSVLYPQGMESDYFCSVLGRYRRGPGDPPLQEFVGAYDTALEIVV